MIGISETWKDQRQLWEPHLGDLEDKPGKGRRGGMREREAWSLRSPLFNVKEISRDSLTFLPSISTLLPLMPYARIILAFARSL